MTPADRLRRDLARLHRLPHPERIVLAPGILAALRILFPVLGAGRVLCSDLEYFGPDHFPAGPGRIAAHVASPVSWRGERLPMPRGPLVVADITHAGADGFPDATAPGADLVAGDATKWLAPAHSIGRLAFLWPATPRLATLARRAFAPFYLATRESDPARCSRWVHPADIDDALRWTSITRALLDRRHASNLAFRDSLAMRLGAGGDPSVAILWLRHARASRLLARLEQRGLLWRPPGGGIRILCRAEAAPEDPA